MDCLSLNERDKIIRVVHIGRPMLSVNIRWEVMVTV